MKGIHYRLWGLSAGGVAVLMYTKPGPAWYADPGTTTTKTD